MLKYEYVVKQKITLGGGLDMVGRIYHVGLTVSDLDRHTWIKVSGRNIDGW